MWKQRFGNSADRDEAQYRRGAALGLTFGELFLLLAFILLLLLGLMEREIRQDQADRAAFEPVRAATEATGASPEALSTLVSSAGRDGLDSLSRTYVAATDAGIDANKLDDVLAAMTDRPPEDFDMVRRDLALGAQVRKNAPLMDPDDFSGLTPDTLRDAVEIAKNMPPELTPDKLALALDIAADFDEGTVDAIRQAIERDAALGGDIAQAVGDALGPLIARTGGSLDRATGSVTLPESVLFERNSDVLTGETRSFLTAFCGPWIQTVHEFGDRIAELRIEGHSSSEWGDLPAGDPQAYIGNLDLSQRRSAAVLQFCLGQELPEAVANWARQRFVAVGLSSSRPVLGEDGLEDPRRSRRVVFGLQTDKEQVLKEIRKRISTDDEIGSSRPPSISSVPKQQPPRARYQGPARVIEAGLLSVDGATLRLSSVDAPTATQTCPRPDGQQWPCGRIAAYRLAQWLSGEQLDCVPVNGERDVSGNPVVRCNRDGQDVAQWLRAAVLATVID